MARVRDSQRSKVYAAERTVWWNTPRVDRTLGDVQEFVDRVLTRKRVVKRFGQKKARITAARRGGSSYVFVGSNVIHLNPEHASNTQLVLHELAHVLAPFSSHGHEFADAYLFLVREVMGVEIGDRLKAAFKQKRVRTKPKATRTLTDEQRQALRDRMVALRQRQLQGAAA